ncbi:MAG: hypothetical protein ACO1TE_24940 [Prosthecobacter sp.]
MRVIDRVVLLTAAGVALAVSILTGLYPEACVSCLVASVLVGSVSFSWAGMAFYSVLILLILLPRGRRAVLPMVAFAAGAHGVLLFSLFMSGHTCWMCVTAGASVIAAFVFAACRHGKERGLMLAWVVIGILTSQGLVTAGEMYDRHLQTIAVAAATEDAESHVATPPGKAGLVVYSRPGCHHCELFETEDIPRIKAEFGEDVLVHFREPPDDLPSPAVIVLPGPVAVFLGQPSYDALRTAVLEAQNHPPARKPEGTP